MSFHKFTLCQILTFCIYLMANLLVFGGQDNYFALLLMNFITFFLSAWLITFLSINLKNIYLNVLSVAIGFNTTYYLLEYALSGPIPSIDKLALDYLLAMIYTVLGIWTGMRYKKKLLKEHPAKSKNKNHE